MYVGSNLITGAHHDGHDGKALFFRGSRIWAKACTITQTLDGVTSDAPSSVAWGDGMVVTLTATSGNKVKADSVAVTMGGVDITSTAYDSATNTITIASVTGNVGIAAGHLPYEAEVEYLESDGTAYINTNVNIAGNVRFIVAMNVPVVSAAAYLFGGATNSTFGQLAGQLGIYRGASKFYWRYGASSIAGANNNAEAQDFTFDNKSPSASRTCMMNGVGYVASSQSFSTSVKLYLFGWNNNGSVINTCDGLRLKSAKIYTANTTLARDYVPVRKNGVGYLYDKVSGELFGNAASSGAFTYGNDK